MTIKVGSKVLAPGISAVLKVVAPAEPTGAGPVWTCVWTSDRGRECRRGFLASVLVAAPKAKGERK